MPRKVFVAGEILTAADVNEFLSDQVVMTFAGTAARGSAIGTAVEGMVTYLEDSDSFEYWDGSAWDELTLPVSTTSPVSGDSLVYDGSNWVNGPRSNNAIINGDFGLWQRGTSFSSNEYTADRWLIGLSGATGTTTREAFTPADIEAIGYGDAEYFLRLDITGADDFARVEQRIEDVRTFAGQEVTLSFWLKSDATSIRASLFQDFGSGGSSDVNYDENFTPTTSWVRYSFTYTLGSMSGKTIGSGSSLDLRIQNSNNETFTLDVWGVQLEAGPVATPFTLAGGGSKAAELALCQRYYQVIADGANKGIGVGYAENTTTGYFLTALSVEMRTVPSLDASSGSNYYAIEPPFSAGDGLTARTQLISSTHLGIAANSGFSGLTSDTPAILRSINSSAFVAVDAEL